MTSTSSLGPTIKIVAQEPFAKLEERRTYRVRIVPDKRSAWPSYAIAAMRCENREEIHWISVGCSTPTEVARLMRSGFELTPEATQSASEVFQELLKNGNAVLVDAGCAAAA